MVAHQTGVKAATKDGGKVSKTFADYVDNAPNGREPCRACSMFRHGGSCTYVRGDIDSNGHCKFWSAK